MVHPNIVEFFEFLKMEENIACEPPVSAYQSVEDYKKYWKKFRERVMSSYSGIHNGHYIAATNNEYVCQTTALLSSLPWILGVTLGGCFY